MGHLPGLDGLASLLRLSSVVRHSGIPTSPAAVSRSCPRPTSLHRQTRSRKDIGRKTVNMEGFSMQTTSIHEEWMDIADIVNDLENDLEKKKLSDFSGFDVVGHFNNNNSSDKSFQRQPSYLEIIKEIEGEELMLGIDSAETTFFTNNNNVDASVVVRREGRRSSLNGYSHYSPASPS